MASKPQIGTSLQSSNIINENRKQLIIVIAQAQRYSVLTA